jgi:hypothetical protein
MDSPAVGQVCACIALGVETCGLPSHGDAARSARVVEW